MPEREYQHNFARMVDGAMYRHQGRERKAKTIQICASIFKYVQS
jgi:hypothetical protein